MKCAICSSPLGPPGENTYHPLCSARCKTVDLSKWLNAEYVIQGSAAATDGLGDGFAGVDLSEFEE
mgnify:CR=1 FL=1